MSANNLFHIELEPPIAPKRVLRDQALFLAELSNGTITARVETTRGNRGTEDYFNHRFRIRVPQLDYTMTLCEVSHPIDVYPLQGHCDEWIVEKECGDSEEFLTTLSQILNSPETKRRLESLKSLALAETDQVDSEVSYESPPAAEEIPESVAEDDAPPAEAQAETEAEAESDSGDSVEDAAEMLLDPNAESDSEDDFGDDDFGDDFFVEWGEPVELNDANVNRCPESQGAAIIYQNESPLFIAYSGDIRGSLAKQLGGKANSVIAQSRKNGLTFICGSVSSIDDAENTIESIVKTPMFRALLGDEEANDWL